MTVAAPATVSARAAVEALPIVVASRRALAFADFHVHTRSSRDSLMTEDRLIRLALERGLTHVAVTNHNNVEGAVAVRDRVVAQGLEDRLHIILGEEVSTSDGEVVGIFLTDT